VISADGRRAVVKSNYREIRIGAPSFGEIAVTGGQAATSGRVFGEAMAFSDDSRYLGLAEYAGLTDDGGLHTRVVVFDLDEGTEFLAFDQPGGLIEDVRWAPDGALSVSARSPSAGPTEAESVWTRPEPGAATPASEAPKAPKPPPRLGAARAIWMLVVYFLVQLAVGLAVGIGVAIYARAHGMSGPRAVAWLMGGGLFPIAIAASLASAGVVYRMVRRSLPGRLASGALAEVGWAPSTRTLTLGGALVGAVIALFYLRVATVWWPMSPQQSIGPVATAVTRSHGWALHAWAVLAVLLAPPLEEFVFRGALLTGLRRSWGILPAAAFVTTIFVAAHLSETHLYYPALASVAAMAICALLARVRTGSLLPAIALHGAYNLMVAVAVYAQAG
jgi:uncharacterized protein